MMQGASTDAAAAIAQDTFARALAQWNKIRSRDPRTWSFRVAAYQLVQLARSRPDSIEDIAQYREPADASMEDPLLLRDELTTALAALPIRQRQVMSWILSGYTPSEIASQLGMSPEVVRTALRHARQTLRARFAARAGREKGDGDHPIG